MRASFSFFLILFFICIVLFKMFTIGSATLPEYGMGRIGDVLAEKIPTENMMFNARCVIVSIVQGPLYCFE
jgi:hypothetical protein